MPFGRDQLVVREDVSNTRTVPAHGSRPIRRHPCPLAVSAFAINDAGPVAGRQAVRVRDLGGRPRHRRQPARLRPRHAQGPPRDDRSTTTTSCGRPRSSCPTASPILANRWAGDGPFTLTIVPADGVGPDRAIGPTRNQDGGGATGYIAPDGKTVFAIYHDNGVDDGKIWSIDVASRARGTSSPWPAPGVPDLAARSAAERTRSLQTACGIPCLVAAPPAKRTADGSRPRRRIAGRSLVQSTTVEAGPPRIGPPSITSAIASPRVVGDLLRVAGSRARRRGWRRSWAGARGPRRARAARRGRGPGRRCVACRPRARRAATTSRRTGSTSVRPPGQNRSPRSRAAGVQTPERPSAWSTSASSTATAFSGGRRLAANRRSMASGRAMSAAIP